MNEPAMTVSAQIPVDVYAVLLAYLDRHPSVDQDTIFTEALSSWLAQFTVDLALEK
jgi:hypothetical protein